jgi:hypothetical protein
MSGANLCRSIFIDSYYNIYCAMNNPDQITKRSFSSSFNGNSILAGNGSTGSAANMLSSPSGIFVDNLSNLYVADSGNNRIQLFGPGQINGTSILGYGSNNTFALYYPTIVVLDGHGDLFIVDSNNTRIVIVRSNVTLCIIGYFDTNWLFLPNFMLFDIYQNIFVSDWNNSRIQNSMLTINLCSKLYFEKLDFNRRFAPKN